MDEQLGNVRQDRSCSQIESKLMSNKTTQITERASHEIEHGKFLAAGQAESLWGWGSPAGEVRALKRGRKIIAAAQLSPGVRALELGCGTGLFTQLFAQTGANITANDISSELIDLAKKQNPGVEFIVGRFEDLSESKSYDAIVGSSVLHHLEVDEALRKSHQLLRPGGRFTFAEPNMLNPQVFAERTFMRNALPYVSPDETAFVRWSLARKLKSFGFTAIKITPFDWLHPAIPKGIIKLVEGIGGLIERAPLLREFSGSLLISAKRA
jgi:2-polyprenyl-3-methyl-5-hydroxy-6-metoxy-1,4-benzoquinol methylase